MIRTLTLIAAVSMATATVPAAANTFEDAPQVSINVADLDLASAHDRGRLDTRVRTTINSLCRAEGHSVLDQLRAQNCRVTALASVAPQVDRAIALAQRSQRMAALDVVAAY